MLIRWQYYGFFGSNGPPSFFVGVVLMLLSALVVALVVNDVYRLQRLAMEGLPTIGTVIRKTLHRANDQGTVDTSYEVEYVYATAGGRRLEGSDTVDPTTWDGIAEGAQIPVEYAANRPTIQRIGDRVNPPIGGELAIAAASILGSCGAVLAIKAFRMPWRAATRAAQTDSSTVLAGDPGPMLMKILAFLLRWVSAVTVCAVVTLCLGGVFLPTGLVTLRQESLFRRTGETVSGTILTKSVRRPGHGRGSSTQYDVGYRFITHAGITVQGSDHVSGEIRQCIVGDHADVVVFQQESRERIVGQRGQAGGGRDVVLAGIARDQAGLARLPGIGEPDILRHGIAAMTGVASHAGVADVVLPVRIDVPDHLQHAPRDDLGVAVIARHVAACGSNCSSDPAAPPIA